MNQNSTPMVAIANGEDGLVAIGGDLSPQNLIACYKKGIFPWFVEQGIPFWFCPDPRLVLYPRDFKISTSLKKSAKKFDYTINKDFYGVISSCSISNRKNQEDTWISQQYIEAYSLLNNIGNALSVEVWQNNKLVGGLYGVYIKPIFFGESMFHSVTDASKCALMYLVSKCDELGIVLIDCQQATSHLKSLGAQEMRKTDFLSVLKKLTSSV